MEEGRSGNRWKATRTASRSPAIEPKSARAGRPSNLYLLFICPYEELYLHPNPSQTEETNELWDYDVAEAFIGTDFKDIRHYTEYEVSPQGEWVDLDIDRNTDPPSHQRGSGTPDFKVKARIDREHKIWYGEMQIPFAAIDYRQAGQGRGDAHQPVPRTGAASRRKFIAWQPTHSPSFHVPEAFGLLVLK